MDIIPSYGSEFHKLYMERTEMPFLFSVRNFLLATLSSNFERERERKFSVGLKPPGSNQSNEAEGPQSNWGASQGGVVLTGGRPGFEFPLKHKQSSLGQSFSPRPTYPTGLL